VGFLVYYEGAASHWMSAVVACDWCSSLRIAWGPTCVFFKQAQHLASHALFQQTLHAFLFPGELGMSLCWMSHDICLGLRHPVWHLLHDLMEAGIGWATLRQASALVGCGVFRAGRQGWGCICGWAAKVAVKHT
jgi:hypothetical protein